MTLITGFSVSVGSGTVATGSEAVVVVAGAVAGADSDGCPSLVEVAVSAPSQAEIRISRVATSATDRLMPQT
jgi:hypothetical protein